jgi:hypothetical protein
MFASAGSAPNDITLYTSLPPKSDRLAAGRGLGTDYQRECIASWRRLGFDVVSLNPRDEIETLLPLGYDVTFKEVASKRPRINDFLAIMKDEPDAVAGIINADCILVANDPIIALVIESARQGLVLTERLNVGADDLRPTGMSCYGFDFFLFSKHVLNEFKFDPEMAIGAPWWDYWFPIAYHLAGGQLFIAPAPILMHLDHPQGWSWEGWLARGRRMHEYLANIGKSDSRFSFVNGGHMDELSQSEVQDFSVAVFQWLKTAARIIEVKNPSAWLWSSVLTGIDTVPRLAREAERSFEEERRCFEEARSNFEEAKRSFEEAKRGFEAEKRGFEEAERRLKESLSWKVTRPLRGIERKLSQVKLPTRASSFRR